MQPDSIALAPSRRLELRTPVVLGLGAVWMLLITIGLAGRPLLPIDETRYASVAWEMWVRGDLLVPHLNGVPYSDKPPLLFWLIQLAWTALGVHEVWARLVPPLFGLACLPLTAALARRLWPQRPGIAREAPVVLLGTLLWTLFGTVLMFDMPVAFFDLAALAGILAARGDRSGSRRWGWPLAGAALGLGILAKGPVALLVPLFVALAAPWWARDAQTPAPRPAWGRWYAGLALAVAMAAAIALAWALPAAAAGGPRYAYALLLTQTEERLVRSFAHERPWWWYLPLLPGLLFPVALWPPLWRALARLRARRADLGTRFCLAWLVPALLCFSAISGKQPHYLLPLVPAFALLAARAADGEPPASRRDLLPAVVPLALLGVALALVPRWAGRPGDPGWLYLVPPYPGVALAAAALLFLAVPGRMRRPLGLAALSWVLVAALHLAFHPVAGRDYDVRPIARHARHLEQRGVPVAWSGDYHGQLHFEGRLTRPFEEILTGHEDLWLAEHPGGRVIAYRHGELRDSSRVELVVPYRDGNLIVLWTGPAVGKTDTILVP